MICPKCQQSDGAYSEIEDFNPGSEPEWSYYTSWQCYNKACLNTVYSYEDDFVYGENDD